MSLAHLDTGYVPEPGTMQDVLEHVGGMSYRQLDYWTRCGYLKTISDPTPGSGCVRVWDVDDYPVLRRVTYLLQSGMALSMAFRLARHDTSELASGVYVTFALDLQ